jgi:hypothetical protein
LSVLVTLNSYPTKPFSVRWTCDQEIESKDQDWDELENPKDKSICTHNNTTIMTSSNLRIESLEADFVCPPNLKLPTMGVFEEVWEIRNQLENLDESDEDFEQEKDRLLGDLYLMNIAQWCAQGSTLQEKLDTLKNSTDMGFQGELEISIAKIPAFGVSEELDVTCEACGGEARRRLSLDYLSFFP